MRPLTDTVIECIHKHYSPPGEDQGYFGQFHSCMHSKAKMTRKPGAARPISGYLNTT
jgi:hypothetical protein